MLGAAGCADSVARMPAYCAAVLIRYSAADDRQALERLDGYGRLLEAATGVEAAYTPGPRLAAQTGYDEPQTSQSAEEDGSMDE